MRPESGTLLGGDRKPLHFASLSAVLPEPEWRLPSQGAWPCTNSPYCRVILESGPIPVPSKAQHMSLQKAPWKMQTHDDLAGKQILFPQTQAEPGPTAGALHGSVHTHKHMWYMNLHILHSCEHAYVQTTMHLCVHLCVRTSRDAHTH